MNGLVKVLVRSVRSKLMFPLYPCRPVAVRQGARLVLVVPLVVVSRLV